MATGAGTTAFLSVIVPTFRRPALALQCLTSLQAQSIPESEFELILVDNAADAGLRQEVEALNRTARVPTRYLPESEPGAHTARHAGSRIARGTILVFTDDDVTFDPGWLDAYRRAFREHPDMVAAGGTVRPNWEEPPPAWLRQFMQGKAMFPMLSLMDLSDSFTLTRDGIFFSLNMAIRRTTFFELGGFNPDTYGNTWLGDGETGLNRKLWARGALIGYVPRAVVYHHISAERTTLEYLQAREANDGACDMYGRFHDAKMDGRSLVREAARICVRNARDWLAAVVMRGRTDPRSLRVQFRAARTRAQLAYVTRLLVDPERRALVAKQDWLNE